MNLRCDLHLNGGNRRVLIAARDEETPDHLALRLSAAALFFDREPVLEVGPKKPAAEGFEYYPDLLVTEPDGYPELWVECGNTATNKLTKVIRKFSRARVIVVREGYEEARRFRKLLARDVPKSEKIEIWGWPPGKFREWTAALKEANSLIGEASGRSINAVLNETPFDVTLEIF
ncbi:MAG: hypothetical protein FD189_168 [Elusimicrobia bacterium]|nr:MAG: hypothetical protein FD154_320 [Elusimicrobiota bacterium]KAF0158176.1 MAG: hypothetical protein FD189_168 [Elusimicrobiota bacterium]